MATPAPGVTFVFSVNVNSLLHWFERRLHLVCVSVLESVPIAVHISIQDCFTDLNLRLAQSLHGDLKWCDTHLHGLQVAV